MFSISQVKVSYLIQSRAGPTADLLLLERRENWKSSLESPSQVKSCLDTPAVFRPRLQLPGVLEDSRKKMAGWQAGGRGQMTWQIASCLLGTVLPTGCLRPRERGRRRLLLTLGLARYRRGSCGKDTTWAPEHYKSGLYFNQKV